MAKPRLLADGVTPRCTNGIRHWFTYYGWVGSSSPTCLHCGAENPNYDPSRDPKDEINDLTGAGR